MFTASGCQRFAQTRGPTRICCAASGEATLNIIDTYPQTRPSRCPLNRLHRLPFRPGNGQNTRGGDLSTEPALPAAVLASAPAIGFSMR